MSERFESHAQTVVGLTLLSRVTGLARDAAISRIFGAGALVDAFFFAFMVPNLFRRLFGEGALAAAFLPTYAQLDRDDPATAKRLASLTIALLLVLLGGLTLLGEGALYLVSRHADHENLAVWLMMVTLPYMPMVCMVAILGAMLQVHGRFGPTAAAPIVVNVCLTATAVGLVFVLDPNDERERVVHVGAICGALLVAGMGQVAWSLWALRSEGWWVPDLGAAGAPLRRVMWQAGPMMVGLGVLQLNTFLDGLIASYPSLVGSTIFGVEYPLAEGAMASVTYAQRLYQFPLGVFGVAIATAIFPALARTAQDGAAFADILRRGLRLVVFVGLPASAGLILVGRPLAAVIYQGGEFTPDDAARVEFVLFGYASAVWAYSMIHVLTRAFYATGNVRTPVKVAVSMVALNLGLNCTLIWTPLREAGLAWSTAICAVLQVSLLLALVRRRVVPGARLADRAVLRSWGKSIGATAIMIGAVWLIWTFFDRQATTWREALPQLAALVLGGGFIMLLAALTFRMPELGWILAREARRHEGTKGRHRRTRG